MRQDEDAPVEWAGFRLPARAAEGHFFMVGAPGSGKTLCLQALMASVLRQIEPGTDRRAVIFDVMASPPDTIKRLRANGIRCPIRSVDPFASDGFGWDIGADWTDTSSADHYASLIIPDRRDSLNNFFTHAARSILKYVLIALILKRDVWTLSDLGLLPKNGAI